MIRYSVIIPYVEEDALFERALRSIPERADVEVLPVQDAARRGGGWARNQALDRAKGEWLLFLDADDFFEADAFELLDKHFSSAADVVYFGVRAVLSDTLAPSSRQDDKLRCLARYAARPSLIDFYCRYCYPEPWGKMVRRSLVSGAGIRFDETSCANDYSFSVLVGLNARSVAFDPSSLYVVTERPGSVSRDYFGSSQSLEDRLGVYWRVQQLFEARGVKLYPFYGLWMMCFKKGPFARSTASAFCVREGIGLWKRFRGCLTRIVRKRLHIGVPNCR